ncbi:hypothetical protein [Clostridium hydrogenum]|uniref:hypothetical protein n=1 Tax=Clostridium hydrogenum TaxID=2855764 RepID=UPI001F221BFC|nr:hypothetical protein [Clostridium hydrogenum]
MEKICVLNSNKVCDDCGECDKCDLNPEKICNNCGKCLNIDGFDTRSIRIDDVIEDETEIKKYEEELDEEETEETNLVNENELLNDYDDDYVNTDDKEVDLELIDDIDGLNEILEDEEKRTKYTEETYPGMFVIKKQK